MSEKLWLYVRRAGIIVGVIAGLITISVGLITMWGWIRAPSANLVAEVEYSRFVWPRALEEHFPPGLPYRPHRMSAIWFITVENRGKLRSHSAILKVPSILSAEVLKEGDKSKVKVTDEVIELGDVDPGEIVSVTAWGWSRPSEYDARDIKLTHAAGIGAVVIRAPAGPWWWWMEKNLSFMGLMLFIALSTLLWTWLAVAQAKSSKS